MRPFAQDLRGAFLIEVDHACEAVLRGRAQLLTQLVERRLAWTSAGERGLCLSRGVRAGQRALHLVEAWSGGDRRRGWLADGGDHRPEAEEGNEEDDDDEGGGVDHRAGMPA